MEKTNMMKQVRIKNYTNMKKRIKIRKNKYYSVKLTE